MKHGTLGGYTNHACRCAACTEAHSASCYAKFQRRRARAAATPSAVPHGTVGGYTNWGCRCIGCGEAMRLYNAARAKGKT